MWIQQDLVLLSLLVMRVPLLGLVRLVVRTELAKGMNALRADLLDVLHMRPVDTLFGMAFGVGIIDIRIVGLLLFVALVEARHAWNPPQRTAFAGRRGQI